jgi:hypothetical protein
MAIHLRRGQKRPCTPAAMIIPPRRRQKPPHMPAENTPCMPAAGNAEKDVAANVLTISVL